jgi:hypothetical protein
MLAMQDKIQMLAEVLAFLIIKVTDYLQNRPTAPAGFNLRLFLSDACEQTPNHFRAVDKLLVKNLKFHLSSL